MTDHCTQQWLEPLRPRLKGQTNLKKVCGTPICVCVYVCIEGMRRDHTKILPGHVTEAGMNGAFWLVKEGSHGNRSIGPLSDWEACMYLCMFLCVLEEEGGILASGQTRTAFFIHKQKNASILN